MSTCKASIRVTARHRTIVNRNKTLRKLQGGSLVYVLLPRKDSKLIVQLQGPFQVVKKITAVDYQINMRGKLKTFHINMLREFGGKSQESNANTDEVVRSSCAIVNEPEKDENKLTGSLLSVLTLKQSETWTDCKIC
ncbi:hypothetical protein BgiMline_024507 [Biomphalaria glabrata]|nr:hypothetical protein BgiMline_007691 [Biomphalaria glabrata]